MSRFTSRSGRIVVFTGPTLPRDDVERRLDALVRPPARQGDIFTAACGAPPRALVLLDGAFGQVPAVRHKEILWALSRGIPVLGAGSMGALRAAELHRFGMIGHGLIYRWYRATVLADDDEVAVAMAPPELGSGAMSEALVNMRLTLRHAVRCGLVTAAERLALLAVARALHFRDRSYDALFEAACRSMPEPAAGFERLRDWIVRHRVDRKRDDALGLLRRLADEPGFPPPPPAAGFVWTEAFANDLHAAGLTAPEIES